eukprot:CAMPEP_0171635920 /NCGR_PEP_ID=MMETSP0990-20121206/27034_1 /TAXON_ID=483369 /ORGANISM="non described non described, Strain CCMP2098" /LENGTH=75 /DNA_ID=CAMNT_0012207817 /DNA_START=321 /DNA_END=548 /DNA_ORIENTATION=+
MGLKEQLEEEPEEELELESPKTMSLRCMKPATSSGMPPLQGFYDGCQFPDDIFRFSKLVAKVLEHDEFFYRIISG